MPGRPLTRPSTDTDAGRDDVVGSPYANNAAHHVPAPILEGKDFVPLVRRTSIRASHRVWVAATVTATALAVSACTTEESSPAPDHEQQRLVTTTPPAPPPPQAPTAEGLQLPIAAYIPTEAMRTVVRNATSTLVQRCAARFGFHWSQPHRQVRIPDPFQRRYGVMTAEDAARYGYDLPRTSGKRRSNGQGPASAQMSKALRLVLYGSVQAVPPGQRTSSPGEHAGQTIPAGGCFGEARRTLGIDQIDPTHLAESIGVAMFKRAENDDRVKQVVAAWSECMARAGYDVDSPMSAGIGERSSTSQPKPADITMAKQDVACKKETNLIGVWSTVEGAYQKVAIQKKLPQLSEIMGKWNAAAREAAQILGVPAPERR